MRASSFPKNDEDFIKIPPVMLGAPAQKEMWPKTIYPGTIPGLPQMGLRFNTFFQVYSRNRNNFLQSPMSRNRLGIPRTDFQPGLFSIFTAGNFGDGIAFWVDDDFSVGGANSNGGLGDGYLKFVDIGRLLKLPKDALSLRVGQFEIDLPFSPARTWNISGWDIYDQANFGAANGLGAGREQGLPSPRQGRALRSAAATNTAAITTRWRCSIRTPAARWRREQRQSGGGLFSDSNFKDIYGRFQYRFNLERDAASRNEIQAAGATGPRDHTYLQLGTYYFYGRSVQRANLDSGDVLTAREPFYRTGGDFSFNYRTFNLFGLYMYGHDQNLLPLVPTGFTLPSGFVGGSAAKFSGGFIEADYLALPWVMAIMRWDDVNSNADRINGIGATPDTDIGSFVSPFRSNRQRFTPGIQFLIHANIKASFEYQIRPQQVVYNTTTFQPLTSPFRTNSAVAGLEWVY